MNLVNLWKGTPIFLTATVSYNNLLILPVAALIYEGSNHGNERRNTQWEEGVEKWRIIQWIKHLFCFHRILISILI